MQAREKRYVNLILVLLFLQNSAPAAISLGKEQFSEVIDITSLKDTT